MDALSPTPPRGPQWRRAEFGPRSARTRPPDHPAEASRNGGGPNSALGVVQEPTHIDDLVAAMEEGRIRPSETERLRADTFHDRAAMEEGRIRPSEGSHFIWALTWGLALPLRALGSAADFEQLLFGCQGALILHLSGIRAVLGTGGQTLPLASDYYRSAGRQWVGLSHEREASRAAFLWLPEVDDGNGIHGVMDNVP